MPLRFAAARTPATSAIARVLARKALRRPANDNGDMPYAASGSVIDPAMRAALRHFAAHGLAAAGMARQEAEKAHAAGEADACRWWLEVCRTLDGRLAHRLERSLAMRELLTH